MIENSTIQIYSQMLARENVTIQYSTKAKTAFFDIQNRIITLPLYDFLGPIENQMLTSHEVGHAKFSKYSKEEYKEYSSKYGTLFNIIEDVYIESAMKREYPGLSKIFKEAYSTLFKENMFGVDVESASKLDFFNRLNLYFKVGHCLPITFSQEESEYVAKCYSLHSNEDVINLCQEIIEHFNPIKEEELRQPDDNTDEEESVSNATGSSAQEEQESAQSDEEPSEEPDRGEPRESESDTSEDTEDSEEPSTDTYAEFNKNLADKQEEYNEMMSEGASSEPSSRFNHVSCKLNLSTSNNPKANYCADWTSNTTLLYDFCVAHRTDPVFEDYFKLAFEHMEEDLPMYRRLSYEGDAFFHMLRDAKKARDTRYKQSGRIDTRRLAKYKMTETIFKLRKMKDKELNHGVVILIDYSGSMHHTIDDVIAQAIITCEFCKHNNIAFEVYLFGPQRIDYDGMSRYVENITVYKIADSQSYKPEYIYLYGNHFNSYDVRYRLSKKYAGEEIAKCRLEMGNTPIADAALTAWQAIKDMKSRGIDKTHCIVISDGDGNETKLKFTYTSHDNFFSEDHPSREVRAFVESLEKSPEKLLGLYPRSMGCSVSINGMPYSVKTGYIFYHSFVNAIFKNIHDTFNTDITFSYIVNEDTMSKCERCSINPFGTFVSEFIVDDLKKKGYCADSGISLHSVKSDSFASTFILYKVLGYKESAKRDRVLLKEASTPKALKNKLDIMSKTKKTYSAFVVELAKKIA